MIISTLIAIDQPVTFFATSPTVASLMFHLKMNFRQRGTIAWVGGRDARKEERDIHFAPVACNPFRSHAFAVGAG